MLTIGCPVFPNYYRGTKVPPVICVLVTLPTGMVAKGFELSKGFQPKGLLKGTELSLLVGARTVGPGVVTVGVDPEGFEGPLIVVVTAVLGVGVGWLLGCQLLA